MRFFISYSLRLVSVVLLSLSLNACGLLTFSNLLGTNTLGGAATSGAEALDASEVELFDSGPVDIPVSIAKLDSPDVTLIEVTISDVSLNVASPFLTRIRTLEADTSYTFTFTGSAGAVADPTTTPYILLSNTETGLYSVGSVSATGTFMVSLDGETEQDFILTAMTTSDLTTAEAGPVLIYSADEDGTISVTVTNSSALSSNTVIVVDNFGNTYLSNLTSAGTYNFWRRNTNGAEATLLLSDIIYPIRLVSVFNESSFVFLDEAGQLIMASGDPVSASLRTLRSASTLNSETEALGYTPVSLDEFDLSGLSTETLENNDTLPYSLLTLPGQGTLLLKHFAYGAQAGGEFSTGMVVLIDADGEETIIIPVSDGATTYDDVFADYEPGLGVLLVAVSDTTNEDYAYSSLDLSEALYPRTEAWENRTLIAPSTGPVHGFAFGGNANIIVFSVDVTEEMRELRISNTATEVETLITQFYHNDDPFSDLVKVSADGQLAVACRRDSGGLYAIPLSEEFSHDPILFATPGLCGMKDVAIDTDNRVYFYSLPDPSADSGPDNPPQLTFIDLDTVTAVQEAIGQ